MIKKILIIFSFLTFFFIQSPLIFAQTPTITPTATPTSTQPSWWDQFLSWVTGLFTQTSYTIDVRTPDAVTSDMNDYGDENQDNFKEKHAFAGSRLTDSTSQNCYKGNVIKKTVLGNPGYPNSNLTQFCFDSDNKCVIKSPNASADILTDQKLTSCSQKHIKDLAHYFVQLQKQFYCAADKNQFVNIDQNIIDQIQKDYSTPIPENEFNCYQGIYDDLYLTPKDSSDIKEENTTKMMQTPISSGDQNPNNDSNQVKDQVDSNFSPASTPNSGLKGLRPASW